ncbi:MAG: T9SS type A sorting domain-containing protein [bacterium]|nr:T9SS type A sorting domain-containing protein [bacterium]
MKHLFSTILIILCTALFGFGQNTISVPFPNGFIGNNTGNNSASVTYYLNGAQGVGWHDIRFAQTTNSSIFTQQGNDIPGEVWITDSAGVKHEIPGFIKWRTPSGGNPHTMVFQPAPGTYILATNGYNGSPTYTLDDTKYIGLTKPGATLTISPIPGTVTGNSSTSGLLDALNDILAEQSQLSISGTSVFESEGTAQVSVQLSPATTLEVNVNLQTFSSSALATDDYDSTSLALTFLPGETQKFVDIPITVDTIDEVDEFFWVRLFESTNAAIITSQDSVIISEITLPASHVSTSLTCESDGIVLRWSTDSEHNTSNFFIERSEDGSNWNTIGSIPAQGNSNQLTEYEFKDWDACKRCQNYYRIKLKDLDGAFDYSSLLSSECDQDYDQVYIQPNPASYVAKLYLTLEREEHIEVMMLDLSGKPVKSFGFNGKEGQNIFEIDVQHLKSGTYLLQIHTTRASITERLQVVR